MIAPLLARSRVADTRWETGLTSTNVCSHFGSVSAGTNAFDRNVSGNRIIIEMPWTLRALRAIVPTHVKIHAMAQPVKTARTIAATTPATPPPGR